MVPSKPSFLLTTATSASKYTNVIEMIPIVDCHDNAKESVVDNSRPSTEKGRAALFRCCSALNNTYSQASAVCLIPKHC
jgi:hypothetical protein